MSDDAPLPRPDPLPNPSSSTPSLLSKPPRKHVRYRFLTPSERAIFARAVGADMDPEDQTPLYPPTSISWFKPRRRLQSGLYKDVAALRRKYLFYFHAVAFLRWAGMMMQLFVGAALTGAEFEGVEDLIKAVLNTGIVEDTQTVDQAIMECFETYRYTRAVVAANDPSFYTSMAMRRAGSTEAAGESMVVTRPHPRASS
ncbi:hypothetical protein HYQ45_013403 [Verticillium longisporum]|uniref:Uncharacterized protein n=1 Tax=Verticillium longisporum TaxID=100787 RepID=A0A8I2ZCH8_VERLO|nr:hypothetical protein HYQ45_013403 [Verticillium longisporum]